MRRLSDSDRARIHAAITQAEARSDARIACVVLPVSDRYVLYPLLAGALVALIVGAALALAFRHLSFRFGMAAETLAFALSAFLADWFPIRLLIVPPRAKRAQARAFAHREFAARILAPSDHRDGILLFVSLGERYVELVATRAIHVKVGEAAWDVIVKNFVAAAGLGQIADGAVAAISACADHLAQHFPKKG